jgi:hypothetical protein
LSGEWLSAFPLEGATRCGAALRMATRALQEIGAWHPDVVHLHSTFAGLLMRPGAGCHVATTARAPVVQYAS